MKKIFAIALALVMVLSMASAFAAQCVTPNWACAEDVCALGKGKVEVIPYVKGNGCDGTGNVYTANTCAGAVVGDKVYFAVKVTVDENPNTEWWADAALKFELKGLNSLAISGTVPAADFAAGDVAKMIKDLDKNDELKAGEYYIVAGAQTWEAVKAADYSAKPATLFSATVTDSSKAKVCAVLDAENTFPVVVNGYTVYYSATAGTTDNILKIAKGDDYVEVWVDKDAKIVKFVVNGDTVETYNHDGSKFWNKNSGKEMDWTCDAYGKFLKGVMDSFNLAFGTCITDKAVKANFGWDDEVKGCFTWSGNVQAVVDAECVVAIPKTGDASVLAWLF